ncbi:Na+/H+ antiporter NhaC family protein [Luteibaculum oceani]|uniref:Na+/H+ antiporter NhaC family protein n=1 Tax=Luteibaculum oceani TaxID=1294296 RepID=A0A5C6V7W5_9FLAO|nr:Na+/H+ antiporter NhaC family protein [Luteibaculum oceani]TXC81343.1 Na+/H+ antiporter NhaC family protein [Luteibaculum oceani]
MKNIFAVLITFISVLCCTGVKAQENVKFPEFIIQEIPFEVEISGIDSAAVYHGDKNLGTFVGKEPIEITLTTDKKNIAPLTINGNQYLCETNAIPLWLSIVPPMVAIVLALIFKEVVSSLLLGILFGSMIMGAYSGGFSGALGGFFAISGNYLIDALNDSGHLSVIVFSVLIGGIVTVISKNGGMAALVGKISKKATSAKKGQMATYFLGVSIFFDDYANTLVVGNTMRPITDKLKISREKLAYLVDSTAAPVAAIAFVTTWIGAELGYIKDGLNSVALTPGLENLTPYSIFLSSLSYSFYPILTLIFMFFLIRSGKDFGTMHTAETLARTGDYNLDQRSGEKSSELEHYTAKEGVKSSGWYALIPILIIVFGTLLGLVYTGFSPEIWSGDLGFWRKVSATIGNSDSYQALLWSSFTALVVAVLMSIIGKKLNLEESVNSAVNGFKGMLDAVIILILAWSLAEVTEQMHTADFLTGLLSGNVDMAWIPAITFVLSAVVAFSTGSSWGTMAIMFPLSIPALLTLGVESGAAASEFLPIFYNGVACVLAGAVLGDHCSPISDTTILSSLATRCNHIAHVRTQLPYALTVGGTALLIGIIPAAFGVPSWICFAVAIAVLLGVIKFLGKPVPQS